MDIKLTKKEKDFLISWLSDDLDLEIKNKSTSSNYLINKLKENNFQVQYYHPNTLFINWNHWIPSYIRNEYKKQTGQSINEFGETIIEEIEEENYNKGNSVLMIGNDINNKNKNNKKYNSILNYTPTGNFN